ncbi:putative adhesin [Spirochaeta cellobiosiphila]|uniref:putative adhesin n=1 Tax=Spirochaeta cellobiosiphila TaxID=504483 RepID=UPI0003F92394|nr:hypothetical protein [Spirochaeta cellobiosiphila]
MSPPKALLILFGQGEESQANFCLRRSNFASIKIYSWTPEGIPIWDTEIMLVMADAMNKGVIRESYSTIIKSREEGREAKDYILSSLNNVPLPNSISTYLNQTHISNLDATVYHNKSTIIDSDRMLLTIETPQSHINLSTILNNYNFNARSLDVLWCACKMQKETKYEINY